LPPAEPIERVPRVLKQLELIDSDALEPKI
jgi:hypothetical protein